MAKRTIKIAPSLLAADFLHLADAVRMAQDTGADMLHFDVMDGHFVPNLSLGPGILEAIRKVTTMHLDVHLMLSEPWKYVDQFAAAGADGITVHLEVCPRPDEILDQIGALGKVRGLSLNPDMPVERLTGCVSRVDRLLLMSVFPGFGGQKFIPESLDRLRAVRALLDSAGRAEAELQVDGGVGPDNAAAVIAAGADCLVAGTAFFRAPSPAAALARMRGA